MKVGPLHKLTAFATVALPILGLLDGSAELRAASLLLLLAALPAVVALHRARSRSRRWAVHLLTLALLVPAGLLFPVSKVDAGLIVILVGVFNRLWLRNGQRDDFILVGAAGVLLSAATVITPGAVFGLILVAFVPAASWFLLTSNLLGMAERAPAGERSRVHRAITTRPAPPVGRALTGLGLGFMICGYLAVSLLPRARFGHLLSPGGLLVFSGAGNRMTLDTGGVVGAGEGDVVVRLDVPSGDAGEVAGLYARVYALDGWDDRGFFDTELPAKPSDGLKAERPGSCVGVSVRRLVGRTAPHPVVAVGRDRPWRVLEHPMLERPGGTWLTRLHGASLEHRYQVCPAESARPLLPDEATRERLTRLPGDVDRRIPALAARLTEGAETARERIRRIVAHFDRGFAYSLDPIPGTADDPIARFLFEARQGHCELYAGALAALLRAAGVPARVAAGYYGGWYNRRAGVLELGSEDAHAWVEVFDGTDWRWLDVTPPDGRTRRVGKRLAFLRDAWDAIEGLWYTYVIDFTEERRRAVLSRVTERAAAAFDPSAWWEAGGLRPRRGGGRAGAWVGGGLLGLGLFAGILGWRRRKQSAPSRLARRLRGVLGKAVGDAERHEPSRRLARRHPRPELALSAVDAVEALRFGPPGQTGLEREALVAVRELERVSRSTRRARGTGERPLAD